MRTFIIAIVAITVLVGFATIHKLAAAPSTVALRGLDTDGASSYGILSAAASTIGTRPESALLNLGAPSVVLRDEMGIFRAYRVLRSRAWLIEYSEKDRIEAFEIAAAGRTVLNISDPSGVAMGQEVETVQQLLGPSASIDNATRSLILPHAGGLNRFYGLGRTGKIDSFGITIDKPIRMPPYIRWFQPNGTEELRPVQLSTADPTSGKRQAYTLASQTTCGRGERWHPSRMALDEQVGMIRVRVECRTSRVSRNMYFALISAHTPPYGSGRPRRSSWVVPHVEQTMAPRLRPGRNAIELHRPTTANTQAVGKQRTMSGSPLRVWLTVYSQPPNGRRFIYPNEPNTEFAYDPTANPTGFDVIVANPANEPGVNGSLDADMGQRVTARAASTHLLETVSLSPTQDRTGRNERHIAPRKTRRPFASVMYLAQNCAFGSKSLNKCAWTNMPYDHGHVCPQVVMHTASGDYYSNVGCVQVAKDPSDMEHRKDCDKSGSDGSAGFPIDIQSGSLWYYFKDVGLSGPFPLQFARYYSSKYSTYQGTMGIGWRSMFDAGLDLSQIASGQITFTSECGSHEYFSPPAVGTTVYDQFSGSTLSTTSSGSYKLTNWNGFSYGFDSTGRVVSYTDRIGNTQTITRNGSNPNLVTSIADALGRSLAFTYDSSNRLKTVTSSPTAIGLTFAYDSGVNCYSGDLCSVTESDSSVWTYQYGAPTNYGGNHLLTEVIDPLNHVEEQNTYASIPLTVYNNGSDSGVWTAYRVTQQAQDGGSRNVSYNYTSYEISSDDYGGNTYTEDQDGRYTNYTYDMNLQELLTVEGPGCHCGAAGLHYNYDTFGKLIEYDDMEGLLNLNQMSFADQIFTAPDGSVSYVGTAVPAQSSLQQIDYPNAPNGSTTRTITYANYPFGDPRQDLMNVVTIPSVDTPGKSLTITDTYSTSGLLTNESRAGYVNGALTTYNWGYTYDSKGRLLTKTGPRTDVKQLTTFAYYPDTDSDLSRRGQLKTVTDALSHVVSYGSAPSPYNTYTLTGFPLSVIDMNAVTSEYAYDKLGKQTKASLLASGSESDIISASRGYDLAGRLTSLVQPLKESVGYGYTNENDIQTISRMNSSGVTQEQDKFTFDPAGDFKTESKLACSGGTCSTVRESTNFVYDTNAQLATIQFGAPSGSTEGLIYDDYESDNKPNYLNGALLKQTYATSSGTDLEFDNTFDFWHNPIQLNFGAAASSSSGNRSSSFDLHGDLQSSTLASGTGAAQDTYSYDDFGRTKTATTSSTGTRTMVYDASGNMTKITDANGATSSYMYDALNRPLVKTSTKTGLTTEIVTRTYDSTTSGQYGIGRLASMTDPSGKTTYSYERRGYVASQARTINGTTFTTSYVYDDDGNISSITYPSGHVATYTYDFADRAASVKFGSQSIVSSASYLPYGPLTSVTLGNGVAQTKSFDSRYRLSSNIVTGPSSTTLASLTYSEDSANRLTKITDTLNGGYDQTLTYSPDSSSAPQLATFSSGSSLWGNGSSTTDQSFQITGLSYSAFKGKAHAISFTAGTNSGQPAKVTIDGSASTIAFDANGSQSAIGSASYKYSPRELLASGDGISYLYDGDNQRVSATLGANVRSSVYDNTDHHLLAESALTSGSTQYEYVWFDGQLVAEMSGATPYYVTVDHLSAPTILTNASGAISWQADYEPYGSIYSLRTSDLHQPIRRPGQEAQEFDDGAGPNGDSPRYFNHARWYTPEWGEYTQVDPLGLIGSQYGSYSYAMNNPYSVTDESGECQVQAFYDQVHVAGENAIGWHESLVMTPTDDRGQPLKGVIPTYFSGRPTNFDPRNFGPLEAEVAAWDEDAAPYNNYENYSNGVQPVTLPTTGDSNCSCTDLALNSLANAIKSAGFRYSPFGAGLDDNGGYGNSNTAAYIAAQALGVQPPSPPAFVWLPGYSNPFNAH